VHVDQDVDAALSQAGTAEGFRDESTYLLDAPGPALRLPPAQVRVGIAA
jgi:hypothetical protein